MENRWEGANVWGDEIWDDLVDVHFPECDGCVAVLRAYIDASTREDSGLLSVAAYMFESGRVRRFRQRWRDTFGADNFSWADLIARAEPFKNLRSEDGDSQHVRNQKNVEHKRLVSAAVEIIREHVIAGAIVSCWKQDVETFSPTWIKGFGHAYSIAGHITMAALGGWAKRNGYKGGIAYVIEAGDEGYDQLEHLLSYSSKAPLVADLYQWAGHSTAPKTPNSPFHAPDLLAWEWGKWMCESVFERKRLMRLSFVALLNERLDRYAFAHLSGDPLLDFFKRVSDLGVQQLQEDRVALSSVPSVDVHEAVESSATPEHVSDPE